MAFSCSVFSSTLESQRKYFTGNAIPFCGQAALCHNGKNHLCEINSICWRRLRSYFAQERKRSRVCNSVLSAIPSGSIPPTEKHLKRMRLSFRLHLVI